MKLFDSAMGLYVLISLVFNGILASFNRYLFYRYLAMFGMIVCFIVSSPCSNYVFELPPLLSFEVPRFVAITLLGLIARLNFEVPRFAAITLLSLIALLSFEVPRFAAITLLSLIARLSFEVPRFASTTLLSFPHLRDLEV